MDEVKVKGEEKVKVVGQGQERNDSNSNVQPSTSNLQPESRPSAYRLRHRHGVRLEMTSLMDVMFLVLVFFIYCIFDMSVHRGLKVDLPDAKGALEHGERIVLTIAADDSLQLNGEPTTREAVIGKVRALTAANVKMPVLIAGDRKASLGVGIELLSELKAAGVEQASFQVKGK